MYENSIEFSKLEKTECVIITRVIINLDAVSSVLNEKVVHKSGYYHSFAWSPQLRMCRDTYLIHTKISQATPDRQD